MKRPRSSRRTRPSSLEQGQRPVDGRKAHRRAVCARAALQSSSAVNACCRVRRARSEAVRWRVFLAGIARAYCKRFSFSMTRAALRSLCNHHVREPAGARRNARGLAAAALAPAALGGVAEIRDAQGHLIADAGAVGAYASNHDGGWAIRFDSATRSSRGVSLTGVSLAGGLVYAERVVVPAHGLRGARVQGLTVDGKRRRRDAEHPRAARPGELPRRPAGGRRARRGQRRRRAAGSSPATRRSVSTPAPSCWSGSPAPLSLPLATGTAARPACPGSPSA